MSGLSARLDRALGDLLHVLPELEAAAIVTMDGLPMASALPAGMHEGRVAAMSAALLSLGERAAEGLGRGALRQVYVEGERGTVYLLAAGEDAVLVGVASRGAKAGLMLYELRHTAAQLAQVLEQAAAQFGGGRPATTAAGADNGAGEPLPWASFSSNQ
ncbi:MAG: roadblock/LC7 domain-containing protein [Frankiaceae bacterium]